MTVSFHAKRMPLFPARSVLATSPGTDDVFPLHVVRPFVISPCLEPTSLAVKVATASAPACVRTVAVERALISDCFVHLSQQSFRRLERSWRLGPMSPYSSQPPRQLQPPTQARGADLLYPCHQTSFLSSPKCKLESYLGKRIGSQQREASQAAQSAAIGIFGRGQFPISELGWFFKAMVGRRDWRGSNPFPASLRVHQGFLRFSSRLD